MGLTAFLLRASRGLIVLSVLAGLTAGVSGVGLIALIQRELTRDPSRPDAMAMACAFVGLCAVAAATRVAAQVAMIRLGQGTVAELGVHLVRRTLMLPLRAFESLNSSALLAALTEDIAILANALIGVPHLCINIPIVIACFAYVGWLSPAILACALVFAAVAIAAYVAMTASGVSGMRRARARQDAVVGHFRTAIGGFRELKQHRGRRSAFLAESLEPDVAASRVETVGALGAFAAAEGWSQLAFFGFIGLVLFGLPWLATIDRPTQISAVFIVLYLMTPLDTILTWIPILSRARASLLKIQALLPEIERHVEEEPAPPVPRASAGLSRVGEPRWGDLQLPRPGRRPRLRARAAGPDPPSRRDRGPGRGQWQRQDDPRQGRLGPLPSRVRRRPGRRPPGRRRRRRVASPALLGRLRRRPPLRRPAGRGNRRDRRTARDGLELLGLAPVVTVSQGVFSTLDLSQGQRRRLALLSAWLEDRPFCILDEWAANQDPAFKRIFYAKLLPEMKAAGKGLLVISHDEDYFDAVDRVVRLREGRVLDESPLGVGGVWT